MFDQCLKMLFIFGSYNAVVRGYWDYDLYDEDSTTITSTPTTSSERTTTQQVVGDYDYDLACSFRNNDFCAWRNDPGASQSWLLNPLFEGDYELTEESTAYPFIYYDTPSPRGYNYSIRLISPLYSRVLDKNGCFTTSFKMYTNSESRSVGLRVYQKPDYIALEDLIAYSDKAKKDYILFEVWGNWGNYWYDKESTLKHFDSNFQIILEGIFGEDPMYIAINYVSIMQRNDCKGNTAYPIPRPTTSTTILSTTTTMSTTTTEQPMRRNGDTTDEVTRFTDEWEDPPPASPLSNLWPTTTRPTTTQTLQEGNGFGSRNTQIISIVAVLGIVSLTFACVFAIVLARQRGTYRLNELWANKAGTSSFIDHEAKPSEARYSTKASDDVVIDCNESNQSNKMLKSGNS